MSEWHGYVGIENIALSGAQKLTLLDGLNLLGVRNGGLPHERLHFRVRPDNDALIYEATYDDTTLTVAAFKARLATIFSVSVASISHALVTAGFGAGTTQVVTFSRLGTDYLRVAVFGGVSATREQSRQEALAYLAANAAAWESS